MDETITFFRQQQRYEFDSAESDCNESCNQSVIDRVLGVPIGWQDKNPDIFIYIDDANAIEKVRIPGSIVHITEAGQSAIVHAEKSEDLFRHVTIRANDIQMRVNARKTQLLCIHDNRTNVDVKSYIKYGGEKIYSGAELKILGFVFGSTPSVKPHVEYMLKKARKKLWTLRHVKRAGLGEEYLLRTFNTIVRPTLEYAAPTFHPMLNAELTDKIERIQKRASKLIFGWDSDYDEVISSGRMVTLESRRETLTKNFAVKTSKNARFSDWFRERDYGELNIRVKRKYEEDFAKTERRKKSLACYMQRLLNKKEETR